MTYRILITGSRAWPKIDIVAFAIAHAMNEIKESYDLSDLVIVHGNCPTGADAMAQEVADVISVKTERHPADWDTHGRAAGPIRNQQMVDAGAGVVLAFPMGASRGTRGCMTMARKAGLKIISYEHYLEGE